MKYLFSKKYIKGEISVPILMFVLIVTGIYLSGLLSPLEQSASGSQGIVVPISGSLQKNSLEMHILPLISVTPSPTVDALSSNVSPTATTIPSNPGSATLTQTPTSQSSLLCGTNLGLFNNSDSFLTTQVQNLVKQMHISTIRMPIRSASGDATELQAAAIIHTLGITPLIILHESGGAADISNDKQIITKMNAIFGTSTVYYEVGNEPQGGYTPYITNWNAIVSQLKPVASTNSKFGGPVWFENFSAGEISGMATFIHTANPKPDFISWHEYTCGHSDSAQYCFDHIGTTPGHNWSVHIQSTKSAIQANGDTVPPIFITEWNYDSAAAGGSTPDPRIAPLTQMHFVQTGLDELKKDGVFAAYQYVLNTNSDYNLVNGNSLTGFGQDFAATCSSL